jgi:hypothetical protein
MSNQSINWQKTKEIVFFLGAIFGIFASGISIYNFGKINYIESIFKISESLEINLSEPKDGTEVSSRATRITGRINLKTSADDNNLPSGVHSLLARHKIELVPFVKPLSEEKFWWAQSSPVVQQNGIFTGSVFLGEERNGVGNDFQIIVLAVPKGTTPEGSRILNLPFNSTASNTITVKRVR